MQVVATNNRDIGLTLATLSAERFTESPIVPFGRYRGCAVQWIVESDPEYVEWLLSNVTNLSPSLRREFRGELGSRYGEQAQKSFTRDQIIAANPLSKYAQEQGWQLKKEGRLLVCLCPLHEERSPSFKINAEKNVWYCHGCGAGGSVIDLHSRLKCITIGEAMRELSPAGGANRSWSNSEQHKARQASAKPEERARRRSN